MSYSAVGSWPGTDCLQPARVVFDELGRDGGVPHLVELPDRGPGSDMVGRGTVLLVDMPVDLQPSGWRLVDHAGRDLSRARSMLTQDLDALAEAADGYAGPLKLAVVGPVTLSADVWLPRGERTVSDHGARRELAESLAEGVARHVGDVRRLVPGAQVVVQVDEPSLPTVLAGRLPTISGWGRLPVVESHEAEGALRRVLDAATAAGAVDTLVHCCAPDAPVGLFAAAGAQGAGLDLALLDERAWESVALAVEAGLRLWAGALPTHGPTPSAQTVADAVSTPWRRVGLPAAGLLDVVLTPACGLAGRSPAAARTSLVRVREAADALTETSDD